MRERVSKGGRDGHRGIEWNGGTEFIVSPEVCAVIPDWNAFGVLPPILPGDDETSFPGRSPYSASLLDLVDRFSTNDSRTACLRGFFDYRSSLHDFGIVEGFQWVDGSFVEDVEGREGRPPGDIDVVTFYKSVDHDPDEYGHLFDNWKIRSEHHVDAYGVSLDRPMDAHTVKLISYWYSVWSHRRDHLWKGFVEVSLNPDEDRSALAALDAIIERENREGGLGT